MNKICTSIEQSQKLIELGIDRKSSDMFYWCGEDLRIGGYKAQCEEFDIPSWSFSALTDILDRGVLFKTPKGWACQAYIEDKAITGNYHSNPVDACFETVCWLLKNKKGSC